MAALRPHLALNVSDLDRSIPFYRALFGIEPSKVKPGYAKFEVPDPVLNFTLNEGEVRELGALNHVGIQVSSTDEVLAAQLRLRKEGLEPSEEMDTNCCYARQDKIWLKDPDGTQWEVFTTHEDVEEPGGIAEGAPSCC